MRMKSEGEGERERDRERGLSHLSFQPLRCEPSRSKTENNCAGEDRGRTEESDEEEVRSG